MALDILIGIPLLIFILMGFRDGVVRKLVAIVVIIGGLVFGQLYMRDIGTFLSDIEWADPSTAPMYGFLIIFLGLVIVQSLLYKFLAKSYKIGGIADFFGGTFLGFIEGVIFLSALLLIFSLSGFPSRETKRDARFYKPIVNVAPQILDIISTTGADTIKKAKEIGTPSAIDGGDKKDVKQTDNKSIDKK